MAKEINITIENKLVMEKRDMNVYHHSGPAVWQLRMTRSFSSNIDKPSDNVTIGDDQLEYL